MAHRAIGPGSLVASRFRLEDLLEEHSGARFWRATDLTLARNVAVHVIERDDPRSAAVLTAARTSATVSDPRILRVLDAVEEEDLVHVVHEWGSGLSLDRLLGNELMEPRRAAWLVREVAEAITVAHRQGIAHGRLIPENVLLTDVGSVKLIGFVVDAVLHGRPEPDGVTGSPRSEHESDVLDLGALLYACLTGKWAGFPPSTLPVAPLDHDRVCRPRQVRPGVPKQLDTLCDRIINPALRGGPRLESAAEICAALGDYLGDTLSPAAVDVTEATAFLDPGALRAREPSGTLGSFDGLPSESHPRDALEDTQPGSMRVVDAGTGRPEPPADSGDGAPDRSMSRAAVEQDDRTRPAVRPLTAASAPRPETGGTGGRPPTHWAPDRRESDRPPAPDSEERPGSTWVRVGVLLGILALVLVAVLVGSQIGGSDDPSDGKGSDNRRSRGSDGTSEVLTPAAVDDFDPDGGTAPEENSDMVPLATDGKAGTAWETYTYFDGPVLAPYRSGVGLLLDLGKETEVGEVEVSLVGGPYDLALLAAPEGAAKPTGTEGLTTVEERSGVSGDIALRGNDPVRSRYVVVWLTSLPRSTDGYQGAIAEVVVRS